MGSAGRADGAEGAEGAEGAGELVTGWVTAADDEDDGGGVAAGVDVVSEAAYHRAMRAWQG